MSHSSPRRLASPRALRVAFRPSRERASRPRPCRRRFPEALQALKDKVLAVEEELKGVTVTFVGDNESANVAVADALAKALGYTPLSTPRLVEQVTDSTREEIFAEDGEAGLVVAETVLSSSAPCSDAASPRPAVGGAAARGDCWDYLFGHFTVWLDDVNAVESPRRTRTRRPNGTPRLRRAPRAVLGGGGRGGVGGGAATQAMGAIAQMVDGDPQLPGKKGFYVKMGCRGDWPTLQPPGWDGTEGGKVDPATGKPFREGPGWVEKEMNAGPELEP